jgi:hypothetical protein
MRVINNRVGHFQLLLVAIFAESFVSRTNKQSIIIIDVRLCNKQQQNKQNHTAASTNQQLFLTTFNVGHTLDDDFQTTDSTRITRTWLLTPKSTKQMTKKIYIKQNNSKTSRKKDPTIDVDQ